MSAQVTLDALAPVPRWVGWRNEIRNGRRTKVPYTPGLRPVLAKSDNPATWRTRAEAQRWAAQHVNGEGGGIGIVLGEQPDGRYLAGVDLDTCRAADGTLAPWATKVLDYFPSYAEVSPSGTGVKAFFLCAGAEIERLRAAMESQDGKPQHGKAWKYGKGEKGEHPPAIELYLSHRYFAVTGEALPDRPSDLREVPIATLLWLIETAGPAFKATGTLSNGTRLRVINGRSTSIETLRQGAGETPAIIARVEAAAASSPALRRALDGLPGKGRSEAAFALGAALKREGFDFNAMSEALRAHPATAAWTDEKGDPSAGRGLRLIWDKVDVPAAKPELIVRPTEPDETVADLRDVLAGTGRIFDRGMPVVLAFDQTHEGLVANALAALSVVFHAHTASRPVQWRTKQDGTVEKVAARLPQSIAEMYLGWRGEWRLQPLNGIASAPLLRDDGAIRAQDGYDPATGMWCENVPNVARLVPSRPTQAEAAAALLTLRRWFRTFAFADAATITAPELPVPVVDTDLPPGADESGFLAALLTAVCRPSLPLAPAVLFNGPQYSGAGTGKGLLARCIAAIAFGRAPQAFTAGKTLEELEKRIATELMGGAPMLFLDNLNGVSFKSDLLASAITERPARVRILGQSRMVPLNATAFIMLNGNSLTVSEDLVRRFLRVNFDAGVEDPESRPFKGHIQRETRDNRPALLAAVLTIWRWGRIMGEALPSGLALGSFEQWARWVRDPLLALGCRDPVARMIEAKAQDANRQAVSELFAAWWEAHGDAPVTAASLDERVRQIADPQGRGRQYLARVLQRLAGTRLANFVLTRQASAGKWNAATFALQKSGPGETHRTHRTHRVDEPPPPAPMSPMSPMSSVAPGGSLHGEADDGEPWTDVAI